MMFQAAHRSSRAVNASFIKAIAVAFRLLLNIAIPLFKLLRFLPLVKDFIVFLKAVRDTKSEMSKLSDSVKFFFEAIGDLAGKFADALLGPFGPLLEQLGKVQEGFAELKLAVTDPTQFAKAKVPTILGEIAVSRGKLKGKGEPLAEFFLDTLFASVARIGTLFGAFQEGGVVGSTGLALVHAGEVVIPANVISDLPGVARLPAPSPATMVADSLKRVLTTLASSISSVSSAINSLQTGEVVISPSPAFVRAREVEVAPAGGGGGVPVSDRRPSPGPPTPGDGGGAPTNLEIVIPVSVKLDDLELGRTVVRITEEEIRRQFGTRGIRLAGVG